MALTYTLIQEYQSSSTQSTITFSSIPTTYSHLVLQIRGSSSTTSGGISGLTITVNGVSSGYSYQGIRQTTSGAPFAGNASSQSAFQFTNTLATQSTAGVMSNMCLWIPNYSNPNVAKIMLAYAIATNISPFTGAYSLSAAYLPTGANRVNSISLVPLTSFAGYSSARLYGLGS